MSSLTPRFDAVEKAVYGNEISVSKIQAPFTTIVNEQGQPRQITDLANNMKVSMGIERLMVNSIGLATKEFGPNGEQVFEIDNKDGRVRFVGRWTSLTDNDGTYIIATTSGLDYVEVTFFGTGLNLLMFVDANIQPVSVSVDGGVETLVTGTYSSVLAQRNYKSNQVFNMTSGLSLGVHTVKLRSSSAIAGQSVQVYGFEILNESTQLTINPGSPRYDAVTREIQSQILTDYNTGFDGSSDVLGTKGGRVVVYQDIDGSTKKRLKAVDVAQANLGSADHSNEEIIRRINWREFGANRADDFSTLGGTSDRAFTLDDGTTTLVGNDVSENSGSLIVGVTNSLITLTFIGTGLDIYSNASTDNGYTYSISVDGVSIGTGLVSELKANKRTTSIVSGLPYGTHTVKILNTAQVGSSWNIDDFIIYGPKKPILEDTAIQLADYNIMADFVPRAVLGLENVSVGTIRKNMTREHVYSGTWNLGIVNPNYVGGQEITTSTDNDTSSLTFFGTGIDYVAYAGNSASADLYIDDVLVTAANFPGVTITTLAGHTYNSGTGLISQSAATGQGSGFSLVGLPLGSHVVKLQRYVGGGLWYLNAIDIITPIHINDSSFKIGSLGLKDLRVAVDITGEEVKNKVDLSKAKAWVIFDDAADNIVDSFNVSAVVGISAGVFRVYWKQPFKTDRYGVVCTTTERSTRVNGHPNQSASMNKNSVEIQTVNNADAGSSNCYTTVVAFGELENEENLDLGDL